MEWKNAGALPVAAGMRRFLFIVHFSQTSDPGASTARHPGMSQT
jgi:hypothetical protein